METVVKLERWEFPFFKAEARGFDYIQVTIKEPSASVEIQATISIQAAAELGKHLLALSMSLANAPGR